MQNSVSFGNIQNLFRGYGLLTSCVIFLLLASPVTSKCRECSEDMELVQLQCSKDDENLISAEEEFSRSQNSTKLCRMLYAYFFCVGENVPHCLDTITEYYITYHQSPYDCHPTPDDTVKLQSYQHSIVCGSTTLESTSQSQETTKASVEGTTSNKPTPSQKSGVNVASSRGFSITLGLISGAFTFYSHKHRFS